MKHRARSEGGTLLGEVTSANWIEELERIACEPGSLESERRTANGVEFVVKRGDLRGKAARRHGVRRWFGCAPPRLAEFRNLAWLRKRMFRAPRPLFAGVVLRGGLPRAQFLATEFVPDATPLDEFLREPKATQRDSLLQTLARETARMHAVGFVHRDLYPRNLMLHGSELVILDAWRGGPGFGLRGASYDLACLMLYGSEWLTASEQERFFERYSEHRAAQGRPIRKRESFAASIEHSRARLRARLEQRPHERRGRELPSAAWRVSGLT